MFLLRSKGYIQGILSAFTFGLIPLFSLPLLANGMTTATLLSYRFVAATLITAILMLLRRESFKVRRKHLFSLFILGVIYFFSAMLLLSGYDFLTTGVATVIHFTYPLFVALLMLLFYRQRLPLSKVVTILVATLGVALLSGLFDKEQTVSLFGVSIVTISGLCYALYIIVVNKSGVDTLSSLSLSFYVLGVTSILCLLYALGTGTFSIPCNYMDWGNIIGLSILSTVISNLLLIKAISNLGSTSAAILGALEPLTAVVVGISVFEETLSLSSFLGIVLVLTSVITLILTNGKATH